MFNKVLIIILDYITLQLNYNKDRIDLKIFFICFYDHYGTAVERNSRGAIFFFFDTFNNCIATLYVIRKLTVCRRLGHNI